MRDWLLRTILVSAAILGAYIALGSDSAGAEEGPPDVISDEIVSPPDPRTRRHRTHPRTRRRRTRRHRTHPRTRRRRTRRHRTHPRTRRRRTRRHRTHPRTRRRRTRRHRTHPRTRRRRTRRHRTHPRTRRRTEPVVTEPTPEPVAEEPVVTEPTPEPVAEEPVVTEPTPEPVAKPHRTAPEPVPTDALAVAPSNAGLAMPNQLLLVISDMLEDAAAPTSLVDSLMAPVAGTWRAVPGVIERGTSMLNEPGSTPGRLASGLGDLGAGGTPMALPLTAAPSASTAFAASGGRRRGPEAPPALRSRCSQYS